MTDCPAYDGPLPDLLLLADLGTDGLRISGFGGPLVVPIAQAEPLRRSLVAALPRSEVRALATGAATDAAPRLSEHVTVRCSLCGSVVVSLLSGGARGERTAPPDESAALLRELRAAIGAALPMLAPGPERHGRGA